MFSRHEVKRTAVFTVVLFLFTIIAVISQTDESQEEAVNKIRVRLMNINDIEYSFSNSYIAQLRDSTNEYPLPGITILRFEIDTNTISSFTFGYERKTVACGLGFKGAKSIMFEMPKPSIKGYKFEIVNSEYIELKIDGKSIFKTNAVLDSFFINMQTNIFVLTNTAFYDLNKKERKEYKILFTEKYPTQTGFISGNGLPTR